MAQKSWPWSTVAGLGDGAAELSEAISREFLALYFGVQNPAVEGVSKGVLHELLVAGIATPLSVGSGSAICYGLYINDADTTIAVTTPAVGTTGGRVVLQTNWAGTGGAGLEARTRIAVIMSADGNPVIPALTQAFGTTWEISLASFLVTVAGVITVTDARTFRRSTAMVGTNEIDNLAVTIAKINNSAVTDPKLRNSAGLSVIGRSAAGAGAVADITAAADNQVLRRSGAALGFGTVNTDGITNLAVTTAKIDNLGVTSGKIGAGAVIAGKIAAGGVDVTGCLANDIVDDTKVGNRVPQFYRRQGGNAADWSINGANNYTPTTVRMQGGSILTSAVADVTVTFPVAFSNVPIVYITNGSSAATGDMSAQLVSFNATQFVVRYINAAGARQIAQVHWLAIGPE